MISKKKQKQIQAPAPVEELPAAEIPEKKHTTGKFSSQPVLDKLYEMAQEGNTSAAKIYLDFFNKLNLGITDILSLEDAMACIRKHEKQKQLEREAEQRKAEAEEEVKCKQELESRMQTQLQRQSGVT